MTRGSGFRPVAVLGDVERGGAPCVGLRSGRHGRGPSRDRDRGRKGIRKRGCGLRLEEVAVDGRAHRAERKEKLHARGGSSGLPSELISEGSSPSASVVIASAPRHRPRPRGVPWERLRVRRRRIGLEVLRAFASSPWKGANCPRSCGTMPGKYGRLGRLELSSAATSRSASASMFVQGFWHHAPVFPTLG